MSSPLGIGDVIAVGKLTKDVLDFLNKLKNSSSDYQELRHELDNVQKAMYHVDKLSTRTDNDALLTAIKAAALCCRQPLESFIRKSEKFEAQLSPKKAKRSLKKRTKSLQWTMLDEEVVELRRQLGLHLRTINVMLTTYGLE